MMLVSSFLDRINQSVGNVIRWTALLMVLLQFAIVLLRYVFGVSFIFLNEGVLYLHSTLFMLGAGYTFLVDGHVRVDIFYAKLSKARKAKIDIFGHLVFLLPAMLILLYWTWPTVQTSWAIWEGPISVGGIPASFLLKSLIPGFCILILVQGVSAIVKDMLVTKEAR
ncbi:TRAP transporter small permease subunit [Sneathiella glossodoripedis]|uniref:TRAP transporter small permease subunit n=1 Tax=Sneathiella glossodoripedis TaxID=418853 RepID=UPI000470C4EB|nr:TRAP transporter small permease subunit [Sneathiella glossodoripedis]